MHDLPGPAIDVGDDPIERRVILPRWLKVMTAGAAVLAAVAILVAVLLFSSSRKTSRENCERIHKLNTVGVAIIAGGYDAADRRLKRGEITKEQAYDAHVLVDRQLMTWRSADCPTPP